MFFNIFPYCVHQPFRPFQMIYKPRIEKMNFSSYVLADDLSAFLLSWQSSRGHQHLGMWT